jgi:pimeloyl-ACP methyl ester carboxylesterase
MGGIIGMVAATSVLQNRIKRLVINDIGPEIPSDALTRIVDYVSDFPTFKKLSDFESRIRELYAPFGQRSDQQWHQMAVQCSRRLDNGEWVSHYDPRIVKQFDPSQPAVTIWGLFELITCPLMLVHGVESDVLTLAIVDKMQAIHPSMVYQPIKDCGHAPGLHTQDQLDPVVEFITA